MMEKVGYDKVDLHKVNFMWSDARWELNNGISDLTTDSQKLKGLKKKWFDLLVLS